MYWISDFNFKDLRIKNKMSYFFLYSVNQPHPKRCIPGYLFPMQIAVGPFPHPSFDATSGKFWNIAIYIDKYTEWELSQY